jgi:hypothetical protein
MVGLVQYYILSPGYIYLLEQGIEAVVDIFFECGKVLLNLNIGLLDSIQASSRVLKVVFRSAVYQIIMENSIDSCCN